MARLQVPRIGVDLPVFHGTSETVLSRGVGHLFGSSLPVGGPGSHAVLTAHSAQPNATLFDRLPDLTAGDLFFVDVYGQRLAYRVDHIVVVLPHQVDALARIPGADQLTLVTCTPYAVNSHRLLVRGVRIPYTEREADRGGATPGDRWPVQPWMYPRLLGAVIALGLIPVLVVRDRRAERAATHPPTGANSPNGTP